MDIINPNFISAAFNCTKRKIYSNLAKTELEEISQDKNKKKKKRKEEDFIQLFSDSDSLEEISPSLAKKIKAEESKEFLNMKKILIIERNKTQPKKIPIPKKRNNSFINMNISQMNNFQEEKEDNIHESGSLNIKKVAHKKITSLYQYYTIMEEENNDEEDNNGNNKNERYSSTTNINVLNKYSSTSFSKDFSKNNSQIFNKKSYNSISKSQSHKRRKRRSKLLSFIYNLSKEIDVYYFNSPTPIKINIGPTETVKEIKNRILELIRKKDNNIKKNSMDAYDLRVLDDPKESPDLDVPPLRDYVNVSELMPPALIFLKNPEYFDSDFNSCSNINSFSREKSLDSNSSKKNNGNSLVLEDEDKNSPKKYEVKVFYQDIQEEKKINCVNIFLNEDDTLKNILYYFFKKNLLIIKNENLYFFTIHNSGEDFENGYNLNINIKSLIPPYELDLCYKYFPDLPQALNIYQLSVNKKKVEEKIRELAM